MLNFLSSFKTVHLYAPVEGNIKLIEEVPDTVFAQKIVGDGIALEPSNGRIVAPCDGKIVQIASTNHAVGIQTNYGFDVLIHVGIDTVELKGEGFRRVAAVDTMVKKGDVLLEVDLETIKKLGKPSITPFVITDTEKIDITYRAKGKASAGETIVMKVKIKK
jgi:PTS system glucose-specific IIA component